MKIKKIFTTLLDEKVGITELTRKMSCWCYNCNQSRTTAGGLPWTMSHFIVCPTCGNKRCPRATDHNYTCTNSNDPGQTGSRYE